MPNVVVDVTLPLVVVVARSGATSPTFSEITQASTVTNGSINLGAMKYCWTHGFYPNGNGHTSRECNYKKNGHQEDATFVDMKGGNNTIRKTDLLKVFCLLLSKFGSFL